MNADEGGGGYHFVWARDLYQQVTSILAAGDRGAADRAVTWLFTRQQLADGTFPQNSKVDGTPDQRNLQLDEVGFPIVLAWMLGRNDNATWDGVRRAADAIVANGPATPQERWEETGGYSPSTLSAMIAGLVSAGDLARVRGDSARSALWTGVADFWQRNTEKWMFTTTGPVGDGRYYVRIDDDGDPDDGSERSTPMAPACIRRIASSTPVSSTLFGLALRHPVINMSLTRLPRLILSPRIHRAAGYGTDTRSTAMVSRLMARRGSLEKSRSADHGRF